MVNISPHAHVLIMAGGSGTRLWPISRQENPKQFQAFVGGKTLLQHMVELATTVVPLERVYVMAVPKFSAFIKEQVPQLPEANLLFEPAQKDTGPAIALGMLQMHMLDPQAKVAVLWSDHHIQNPEGFTQMLQAGFTGVEESPGNVFVVGVNPTEPNTGYGYIQMGKEAAQYADLPVFSVRRFTEKPDARTALRYVNSWDYLWNVGYEVMSSEFFLRKFQELQPDLSKTVQQLMKSLSSGNKQEMAELYGQFPKKSIEFLFTQQLSELLVIPADLGWSDLGSWNALHDVLKEEQADEMVTRG